MEKTRFWFQISLNAIQFLYGGGRELNETQPKIPKVEIFYKEIGKTGGIKWSDEIWMNVMYQILRDTRFAEGLGDGGDIWNYECVWQSRNVISLEREWRQQSIREQRHRGGVHNILEHRI